jgi:hypothetical protein
MADGVSGPGNRHRARPTHALTSHRARRRRADGLPREGLVHRRATAGCDATLAHRLHQVHPLSSKGPASGRLIYI